LSGCRARRSGFGDYVDCLSEFSSQCQHALAFGYGKLCRHPDRFEIVARTEAGRIGGAGAV
jgi:citrate lyase beta subunit